MTANDLPTNQTDDEINLFELWDTLVQGKWLILASAALSLLAATTLAFIMTPKYEAKLIASFAEEKNSGASGALGQLGGLAELAGVGGGNSTKDAAFAYLNSRAFIEGFIKDQQLMPILYAKKWDASKKAWSVDDPKDIPSIWQAYNLFSKKILNIQFDKKTSLVTLSITWKDREQAVDWANKMIALANENMRQKAIEETQLTINFLGKELQKTSVAEVQNTIFRVMENQIKTMMMANTKEQYTFKVIDPALVMDEDAFVKPKRPLMMALGLIGGLFIGVLLVFIRKTIANHKRQAVQTN